MITAQTIFELTQSELPCIEKIILAAKGKEYFTDVYLLNPDEIKQLEAAGFLVTPVIVRGINKQQISWNAPTK